MNNARLTLAPGRYRRVFRQAPPERPHPFGDPGKFIPERAKVIRGGALDLDQVDTDDVNSQLVLRDFLNNALPDMAGFTRWALEQGHHKLLVEAMKFFPNELLRLPAKLLPDLQESVIDQLQEHSIHVSVSIAGFEDGKEIDRPTIEAVAARLPDLGFRFKSLALRIASDTPKGFVDAIGKELKRTDISVARITMPSDTSEQICKTGPHLLHQMSELSLTNLELRGHWPQDCAENLSKMLPGMEVLKVATQDYETCTMVMRAIFDAGPNCGLVSLTVVKLHDSEDISGAGDVYRSLLEDVISANTSLRELLLAKDHDVMRSVSRALQENFTLERVPFQALVLDQEDLRLDRQLNIEEDLYDNRVSQLLHYSDYVEGAVVGLLGGAIPSFPREVLKLTADFVVNADIKPEAAVRMFGNRVRNWDKLGRQNRSHEYSLVSKAAWIEARRLVSEKRPGTIIRQILDVPDRTLGESYSMRPDRPGELSQRLMTIAATLEKLGFALTEETFNFIRTEVSKKRPNIVLTQEMFDIGCWRIIDNILTSPSDEVDRCIEDVAAKLKKFGVQLTDAAFRFIAREVKKASSFIELDPQFFDVSYWKILSGIQNGPQKTRELNATIKEIAKEVRGAGFELSQSAFNLLKAKALGTRPGIYLDYSMFSDPDYWLSDSEGDEQSESGSLSDAEQAIPPDSPAGRGLKRNRDESGGNRTDSED